MDKAEALQLRDSLTLDGYVLYAFPLEREETTTGWRWRPTLVESPDREVIAIPERLTFRHPDWKKPKPLALSQAFGQCRLESSYYDEATKTVVAYPYAEVLVRLPDGSWEPMVGVRTPPLPAGTRLVHVALQTLRDADSGGSRSSLRFGLITDRGDYTSDAPSEVWLAVPGEGVAAAQHCVRAGCWEAELRAKYPGAHIFRGSWRSL